jgi:predicted MFS family arabinose efflux permease
MAETDRPPPGLTTSLRVLLPFAAGYLLSYLFRTINGPLSDRLVADFGWDARTLGLLTSAYFFTFAAFQLPLGTLIDRFGPRRVQAALLLVAGGGALLFGLGRGLSALVVARAMIGLGTSGALMAGLKALNIWLPKSRLAASNGLFVMCGGIGAMASTYPVDLLTGALGWRGAFIALSAATFLVAFAVFAVVPERSQGGQAEPWRDIAAGLVAVYRTRSFWRLAPISAAVIGTAFAVHGLWAARWMADVEGISPSGVTATLFGMGAALACGAVALGMLANWLRLRGVSSAALFAGFCAVFLAIQGAIAADLGAPAWLVWPSFAVFGAMTVLSYTMLADLFASQLIGRANGALNVLHLAMAFVIQSLIGMVANLWPADAAGHYPLVAYRTAFALPMALQALALAWFVLEPVSRRAAARAAPVPGLGAMGTPNA